MKKCSKTQQNCAKNVCKYKELAQLEKFSTDGISRVSRFFHLWDSAVFVVRLTSTK